MRRLFKTLMRNMRMRQEPFPIRETDCFLSSFPRSGNTWMRHMIFYAIWPERKWNKEEMLHEMPFLAWPDIAGRMAARQDRPFRLIMTHEPFRPYFRRGRHVYIVRDGRDAVLSYHHYRSNRKNCKLTLSKYIERSLKGKNKYGSWQGHVRSWLEAQSLENVLFVRYEDMLSEPAEQLRKVLKHYNIQVASGACEKAAQRATVNDVGSLFIHIAKGKGKDFKGGTGGGTGKWREAFSPQDTARFESAAGNELRQLGYLADLSDSSDSSESRKP